MQNSTPDNAVSGFYPFLYKGFDNTDLPYRLFAPENPTAEKYPLLVHFHGAGSKGKDNVRQVTHGYGAVFASPEMQKNHPCFILAPQCAERWVDTDWSLMKHEQPPITHYMRNAIALIAELISKYPIDKTRIYLTGQSMGGFAVWDILCRKPELFAAAVAICGGADENKAFLLKDIPIKVFHGTLDEAVKVERSRNIVAALKKAGGNPIYTEYPDVKHDSWLNAYSEPGLQDWLFSFSRNI